jgi:hypothetical protein
MERTLEQKCKHDQVHLHLQIDADSDDGLPQRRRGRTTWCTAQEDPLKRAIAVAERLLYSS